VAPAPKPSTILWENLGSSWAAAALSQSLSLLLLLLMLLLTCAVIFGVRVLLLQLQLLPGAGSSADAAQLLLPALLAVLQQLQAAAVRGLAWHMDRHVTSGARDLAIFYRLYTLCLCNSALLLLVLNTDFSLLLPFSTALSSAVVAAASASQGATTGSAFAMGSFADFEPGWYVAVGTPLLELQLLNVLLPYTGLLLSLLSQACTECCVHRRCVRFFSQRQLNLRLRGGDLPVAARLAQLTACASVCFVFALGMPLMLAAAALSFLVAYWM